MMPFRCLQGVFPPRSFERCLAVGAGLMLLWTLQPVSSTAQLLDTGPLQVRGGVSASAEAYTVSGIDQRRAPATLETTANLSFNLLGLRSGLNLTYSTDQSRLRQSVNQLAFNTAWGWGEVSAGDVNPSFAKYGLRGTTLRGGMVELEPARFRLGLAAGRSNEAIGPGDDVSLRAASFRQMAYGSRVGYGREQGSHLYLTGVYVRDDASSIDLAATEDVTALGANETITPQENWNLTTDAGLGLFQRRLSMRVQATASLLTRDVRAPEVDDLLPASVSFLTVRRSSYVDYAGEASLRLNLPGGGLRASYERVQPGFKSLGVPQMRSDQERIRIQPTLGLFNRRLTVSLNGAYTRNNLSDQLLSTAERRQLGGTVQARIAQPLTVSASYMRLRNANEPASDAPNPDQTQLLQITQTATLTPNVTIRQASGLTHALSVSGSYQTTQDQSRAVEQGLRPAVNTQNRSATLSYSLQLPSGFSPSVSGNVLTSDAGTSETQVLGINAGVGQAFLDQTLRLNLSAGWSRNKVTTQQSAQSMLTLLNPTIDFAEGAALAEGGGSDADQTLWTTRPVYVRGLDDPSAYAWLVNDLLQGTTEQVPSDLEMLFSKGIYNPVMLNQLAQSFETISSQRTATISGTYELPNGDTLRLTVRGLISTSDTGRNFRESQATLRFRHRF